MSKWYGHVVRMGDNRWPKRIKKWLPEGRRKRGLPEAKWETEIEGVYEVWEFNIGRRNKPASLAMKTSNRWTSGKLIHRTREAEIHTNALFLKIQTINSKFQEER